MTTPVTKVDERFSEPGAAGTSWEQARQVLEMAELFWISTVRADGRPHVTPLVAVWSDDTLYFSTGQAEQKAVNLRGNPHVTLTTGSSGWTSGLDVMVEGEAVPVTDAATLRRLAAAWTAKWDGQWRYEVRDGGFGHPGSDDLIGVFAVAPVKVLAFAKGSFSHTTHRF
jgi:nitroimidazol reductase NimA-like FMN-containing flavoprotein (pyridoxamine 5'-phosphate oxidase superfamily)